MHETKLVFMSSYASLRLVRKMLVATSTVYWPLATTAPLAVRAGRCKFLLSRENSNVRLAHKSGTVRKEMIDQICVWRRCMLLQQTTPVDHAFPMAE